MIFVDSNVPMYIVGTPHPNQDRAAALVDEIIDSGEALITNVEVYQEILHRYTSIRRPQSINDAFDVIDGLVGAVLSYGMTEIRAARELLATHVPGLSARDALTLSAVMRTARGCSRVLSFDAGFDTNKIAPALCASVATSGCEANLPSPNAGSILPCTPRLGECDCLQEL